MAVSIDNALDIIYNNIKALDSEVLPLELALGCIVTQDYTAKFDLPRFNNSAMDGYIVKVSDAGKTLQCSEVIYAGDNPKMTLQKGKVIKIMTGAPIPRGGEAIVAKENVELDNEKITLPSDIKKNNFIRMKGEDIKQGEVYLQKGEKVSAYAIASLASQGITHLSVTRKIKVAVFGTGDELRPHFEEVKEHQLYNSNTLMLLARAKELGCEVRYISSCVDTLKALEDSITSTLDADIIITSGGVSVGDKDFTKEAFTNLGMKTFFDKVDIKPGKPTVFGKIEKTAIVNLPGNPLASMVNYELFIRAIVLKMSGASAYFHSTVETIMRDEHKVKSGKHTALLGSYDGKSFMPLVPQMPGMVSPMQKAYGMLITKPEVGMLKKGQKVKMIPICTELNSYEKESLFTGN